MTKNLIATKVKDGWLVQVNYNYIVQTKDEVKDLVRYEGLKIKKPFRDDRVYAK